MRRAKGAIMKIQRHVGTLVLLIVLCLPDLVAAEQNIQKVPQQVFDARGERLGPVVGVQFEAYPLVAFEYQSIPFVLGVMRDRLTQFVQPTLVFASSNCNGSALLRDSNALFGPLLLVGS